MSREGDVYKFNGFKEAVSVVCIAVRWPHPLLKSTCIGIESTVSLQLATKISSVKNLCACMHTCLSKFKVIQLYLGGGWERGVIQDYAFILGCCHAVMHD